MYSNELTTSNVSHDRTTLLVVLRLFYDANSSQS